MSASHAHPGLNGSAPTVFARIMGPVARELWGEPNKALSTRDELRFGTRGSRSVKLSDGTWHDHEAGEGGGVLALVTREKSTDKAGAMAYLQEHGHLEPAPAGGMKIAATYPYTDERGELLFQVCRLEPKDFRQRAPDGRGGWTWKTKGVRKVLYRLPDVVRAVAAGETIYVTEGEKAADALRQLGRVATCSPGGANKWTAEHSKALTGARVVVLADNDEPGAAHAKLVTELTQGVALEIQTLFSLPRVPEKGDVFDFFQASGTLAELDAITANVRPRETRAPTLHLPPEPVVPAIGVPSLPLLWFDDIAPVLDARDFVQGVLTEGSAAVVYGESNAGKTFWATDLALHIAAGREWNGRRVEQGGVVYCVLEGGNGFRNRVSAWRDAHVSTHAPIPFAAVPSALNLLDPEADTPRLIQTVECAAQRMGRPVKLIVIDTLSRALAGGNENTPEDMGALVRNMDAIRAATGACVLFVHHSGKDAAKGARGHSLLRAAVDTEVEVVAREDGNAATVVKQRDMAKGQAFGFRLDVVEMGKNPHGEAVTTCLVTGQEAAKAAAKGSALTTPEKGWLADLTDMFAEPDKAVLREPVPGMIRVPILTREQVRAGLRERGRFKADAHAKLTDADRTALSKHLNSLRDKGKIGMTENHVWLLNSRECSREHELPLTQPIGEGA